MLWFDMRTILFLKNPKIRQTLAQNLEAEHQIVPNPKFEDKNGVQRYGNIIHISSTATCISMSYPYSQTALPRAQWAAAAEDHKATPCRALEEVSIIFPGAALAKS